jgi:hypothetical protein
MRVGRQEDAHEFMRYLIDAMQENLLYGLPKYAICCQSVVNSETNPLH